MLVNLVQFESVDWLNIQPYAALHSSKIGKHQDQVKVHLEKTAPSLDDTALKMLFVSIQQNINEIGVIGTVCPHHRNIIDCVRLNSIQERMTWYTLLWFGHSYVSEHSFH